MLKKLLYVVFFLCGLLCLVLVYLVNMVINRPNFVELGRLKDTDFKEFSAVTSDGIQIHAAFYEGAAGADTVILCHGHGVNMNYMGDVVGFLRAAGYNLLLLDFRAHGRSGGKLSPIGLHEWKDIKAVLNRAKELGYLKDDTNLAAYGRSMGAASLLNGAAELTEIKAFILESSFAKLRTVAANDAFHTIWLPDTPLSGLSIWVVSKLTGIDYTNNQPVKQAKHLGDRAVFLIHNELDSRADLTQYKMLVEQIPQATVWTSPKSWHVCAHKKNPGEFENRVLDFLYQSGVTGRR